MHLIVRDTASLDEIGEPRDLGLPPADFILLSFSDSDIATFKAGCEPGMVAHYLNLAALRHPISVDFFIAKTVPGTKAILVRLLGGLDYWRYGAEELARACRHHGVVLAFLPGDGRADPRLPALSTLSGDALIHLEDVVNAGGARNAKLAATLLLRGTAGRPYDSECEPVERLPECGVYRASASGDGSAAIVFYRSFLLAGDVAPIDALYEALAGGNYPMRVAAYYVPSLKAPGPAAWLAQQLKATPPDVIVNTTAFSARGEAGGSVLDVADCPVIQAAMASSSRDAWLASQRGLSSTDLAMHVVLPEIDGRLFAGCISFKERDAYGTVFHGPHEAGVEHVSNLAQGWARLRRKPRHERRLALILSTYPGRADQIAHAVGLDAPASTLLTMRCLREGGYTVGTLPDDGNALIKPFVEHLAGKKESRATFSLADYEAAFAKLPDALREAVVEAWGAPEDDPAFSSGAISFAVTQHGNLTVALQPERGFLNDRKADYHDPNLPPRHGFVGFYLWLRHAANIDALIHFGAHGSLEWLPGKAVALTEACAPQALIGALPVIYPFIVNDPGEAAQAKRRIGALTIGHNTPPLVETTLSPALRETERLIDEYSSAEGLDKNRRERLARDALDAVAKSGLEEACGLRPDLSDAEALMRVDAFLCDVKAMAIRDGLHILDAGELKAIERALDGRFIEPGPAGAPSRGRADVLPTGRNLYSTDPRTIPTPLAFENGCRLADAIVARYVEDNGDWPRSMVLDLWGSQTIRTGGEEFGAALALLGVKPLWSAESFRVTGFEVVPLMALNRPRVDVTLRISGLLRDMFPAQLAFFHAAVRRVAAREEDVLENPLRRQRGELYRIFGAADGAYGTGVTQRLNAGDWRTRDDLGEAYLEGSSTAYSGEGAGIPARAAFEASVRAADCFVHVQDHGETDILSGLDFAAHEGGFSAAAAALGSARATLYHAGTAAPASPRMRTLKEEVARVLHGRALSSCWIEGQMRHGFRGAAEIASTADAAFAFAATAGAVTSEGIEQLYEAYLGDSTVATFLAGQNGEALAAIQRQFKDAIARSLWKPRRNDITALEAETAP